MSVHLRQICLAAGDLGKTVADLSRLFGLHVAHEDPAVGEFGLENRLLRLDHQFLEVVAPVAEDAPVRRFLKRRGGDGGYMIILQVIGADAYAGIRARAAAMGVRTAFEAGGEGWKLTQFHPGDTGGSFLDIEWDMAEDPTGPWFAAGGLAWRQVPASTTTLALSGATIGALNPETTAERWAELLGVPREGTVLHLADARIAFVQVSHPAEAGISAVDLRVKDKEAVKRLAEAAGTNMVEGAPIRVAGVDFLLSA
jgi:hypothetical protein